MDKKRNQEFQHTVSAEVPAVFLHTDRRLPAAAGAVSLQIPAVRENRIHCHHRHLRDCRVFCRVHDGKKNGKQKVPLGACGGTCLFRGDGADIAGGEPRI